MIRAARIFGTGRFVLGCMLVAAFANRVGAGEVDSGEFVRDREVARILREGRIIRKQDIGSGVTLPLRVWLTLDGESMTAAFKSVHDEQKGLTRFDHAPPELNFVDSFHFDRAAYLLDRRLGLGMVPVTVRRKMGRNDGVLVAWVEGSVTETERQEKGLTPPDFTTLADQRSLMRLFDALIFNIDRNPGNQLITTDDWKLHLIDHTRAFRMTKKLPEAFELRPSMLTRELHRQLESLEESELVRLLKGEIGKGRVAAILTRRDLILAKIKKDLGRYPEILVYAVERTVPPVD